MKKYILLIIIVLIGCTSSIGTGQEAVFINLKEVPTITQDQSVYIQVDSLEALNIDILRDLEKNKIYLSEADIQTSLSNDRPYNWYVDQGTTGTHAGNNCGPSSVIMASIWQNEKFTFTPEEARGEFRSSGGWWYTDDIKDFFDKHKISYDVDDYDGAFELVATLNAGHIILLCVDTTYIEEKDDEESYIGKFYGYDGGHFLIVKGYTYIEDELYFEVYDSNCWGETYDDGSPKGKDRLYPADELDDSIEVWWDNYIIIENN